MSRFKLMSLQDGSEKVIDKEIFVLGRESDCDIVLSLGYPSRVHAQIILKDDQIHLDDLNSTNGTFVNGQRIETSTPIKHGDILKFATNEFRLLDLSAGNQTMIQKAVSADSYFVVEEDIDLEKTALRQHYPLPAGWPVESPQTRAHFFSQGKSDNKGELKKINKLVEKALSSNVDDIYVAALVFTAESVAPIIYGISLDSDCSKWSIGRNKECSFTVDLPSVSERHAELSFFKGKWLIQDNDSTNGLRQGEQLKDSIELSNGSKVSLGQVDMFFLELKWRI